MSTRFSPGLLFRIRNRLPVAGVIQDQLHLPCKHSEGIWRFLCPVCSDFHTAANPRTNLARCFRCRRNFNPIDILMAVDQCTFVEAVTRLRRLLPDEDAEPDHHNPPPGSGFPPP